MDSTPPPGSVNADHPDADLDNIDNWESRAAQLADEYDENKEGFAGWLAAQWRDQKYKADRYGKRSARIDLFMQRQGLTREWQTWLKDYLLAGGDQDEITPDDNPAAGDDNPVAYDDEAAHAALTLLFDAGGREAIAALAAPQPGKLLLWCPDNGQPVRVTWDDGTVIDGWQIDLSFERVKDPSIPTASLIRVGLIVPDDPARARVHFADAVTPRQPQVRPVDQPAAPAAGGHAYTSHGRPCCGQVPIGAPKGTTHRCLGDQGCTTCQAEIGQIHAGFPMADTEPVTPAGQEDHRG